MSEDARPHSFQPSPIATPTMNIIEDPQHGPEGQVDTFVAEGELVPSTTTSSAEGGATLDVMSSIYF